MKAVRSQLSGASCPFLTSRGLQPLLFDAVPDLGFWVALGEVAGDDGCVPLIYFNHMLHIELKVLKVCEEKGRFRLDLDGDCQCGIHPWWVPVGSHNKRLQNSLQAIREC